YSKNAVRNPLNKIINETIEKTIGEVNLIQTSNNNQYENNTISENKIRTIQEHIDNLQKYSLEMDDLTSQINKKTNDSLDFTNNEYNAVKTNIEKMFSIRHKIQTIAELILELSDFVQSISSTIGLVEDIAEQTNLLALNAAVEAARAGEHGKGFAVVASEIRKLADESKQATSKIISLINDIQQTANSTVLATEEGTKEIESGIDLAQDIGVDVTNLVAIIGEVLNKVQEVNSSNTKIKDDTKKTTEYIEDIEELLKNNYSENQKNVKTIDDLNKISDTFKNSVN
ncbi:hypothetical protein IKA92_01780, partial [bacterium]|nr:hypothetical protein [bacterium]